MKDTVFDTYGTQPFRRQVSHFLQNKTLTIRSHSSQRVTLEEPGVPRPSLALLAAYNGF